MHSEHGPATAKVTFEVADVKGATLLAGKLVQRGFQVTLAPDGSYLEKTGKRTELVMKKNSFLPPSKGVCG